MLVSTKTSSQQINVLSSARCMDAHCFPRIVIQSSLPGHLISSDLTAGHPTWYVLSRYYCPLSYATRAVLLPIESADRSYLVHSQRARDGNGSGNAKSVRRKTFSAKITQGARMFKGREQREQISGRTQKEPAGYSMHAVSMHDRYYAGLTD